VTGDQGIFLARAALTQRTHAVSLLLVIPTVVPVFAADWCVAPTHGGLVAHPRAWGAPLAPPMLRISSSNGPEATWERAWRFAPPAHGDQCPSHAIFGSGSLCQRLSCSGARYAPGGVFQGARGAIS
jgi:hypothetical protein